MIERIKHQVPSPVRHHKRRAVALGSVGGIVIVALILGAVVATSSRPTASRPGSGEQPNFVQLSLDGVTTLEDLIPQSDVSDVVRTGRLGAG